MRPRWQNLTVIACLVLFAGGSALAMLAADDGTTGEDRVEETIEVKRAETKDTKHPSLQFLKDNRVFLRARLDLLSVSIKRTRSDEAEIIDERYLMLEAMSRAIAAARDTVSAEHSGITERELLGSVTELADLEAELDLMNKLLAEQRGRLLMLEQDFLGHQQTSLVIIVKGLRGKNVPESIAITEDNDIVRVPLTPEQRASLAQGGIAQIYHEFVEPREHVFGISFTGKGWVDEAPVAVVLEAQRDRLTFLELDLSQLDRGREASGLLTSVWYR